jgi:tetratricopeptide (TPR) repeat protein
LRRQIVAHFEFNLNRLIDIAQSVEARVIFVTPACNLRDFSPFKSEFTERTSAALARQIDDLLAEAKQLTASGNPAEALARVDRALELDARFAESWFQRGRVLLELGRSDDARQAFVRARDEDVCPLRALSSMQKVVRQVAERRDVPLIDFDRIVADLSPDGIPGENLFHDHVHPTIEGHKMLALEIIDKLTELHLLEPASTWGEKAIGRVARSIESRIEPTAHAEALVNLSKVLGWAGKRDEAARVALRAVDMLPDNVEAQYEAGNAFFERKSYDEARRCFRRTLELNSNFAPAYYGLGLVDSAQGNEAAAVARFRRAVDIDPSFSDAHYNLGNSLMALDRLDDASREFQEAVRLTPDNFYACNNLGVIAGRRREFAEAEKWFRRALDVAPAFVDAHVNLGRVCEDQDRKQEAIEHYRAALRIQPDHPIARQQLKRLLE